MIGLFSKTTDSNVIKSIGLAGFDFVILDMEHGYSDYLKLSELIQAALLSGIKPIVRVEGNNEKQIMKCLELGAMGVQVPNICNEEGALNSVNYTKFSPFGKRGLCRFVPEADFGFKSKDDYFKDENAKLLIIQVEGIEAINDLDAILSIDEIDIVFIGPYDLSQSIGMPGEITNPKVKDLIIEIIEKAKSKNKSIGIFTDTIDDFKRYQGMGVNYIAHSVDLNIITNAFMTTLNEIKKS